MSNRWVLMLAFVLTTLAQPVGAQEQSASAPIARELTALLDQRQLDSVAAQMPDEADRFVGALYYPNAQLLVVSARYTPALMQSYLSNRQYRDVYITLHSNREREGQFFVFDLQANGLPATSDDIEEVDVIHEDGFEQTTVNGDWRSHKISEAEYEKRLKAADARYAKMLQPLVSELKTAAATAAAVRAQTRIRPSSTDDRDVRDAESHNSVLARRLGGGCLEGPQGATANPQLLHLRVKSRRS